MQREENATRSAKRQSSFPSLPLRPVSGVYPHQAAGDALQGVLDKAVAGGELGQDPSPCDLTPLRREARSDGMCRDPA